MLEDKNIERMTKTKKMLWRKKCTDRQKVGNSDEKFSED